MTTAIIPVTAAVPEGWPPLAQDVWADRDGVEYIAHVWEANDRVWCEMGSADGKRQILPSYLLETRSPLRLVAAGWERARAA